MRDHRKASAARSAAASTRGGLAVFALALVVLATLGASSALAATPELKIDPTVTAAYTSVEFSGEVNPKGDPVEWYVEKSTDGGANWEFGETLGFSEENAPQLINNAVLGGLALGTTYRIRISAFDYATEELLVTPEPSPEFTTKSVTAPTVSLDPVTTKSDTTAHLSGHVDPNSPGGLDDAGKAVYLTTWQFHCTPDCPGLKSHELEAEAGNTEVTADVTGLEPNTEYTVTLTATNAGGEGTDGAQSFFTDEIAPSVTAGPGSALGDGKFQLVGTVNPHNSPITSCYFEYGPTTSYDQNVPCETIPGPANKVSFVTASISGLVIGAEYHFRLIATNGAGPAPSADAVFLAQEESCTNQSIRREQHSTYLPECRAYEQVTPAFKEAFPPAPAGVGDDGRLVYVSSGNFAGNGNGTGSVPGGNLYLGTRTESGWSTKALSPSGPEYHTEIPTQLPRAFSSDLRSMLWAMRRGDEAESVLDLYVWRDGAFSRIGPLSGGNVSLSSDDLSHTVFLAAGGNVYEYVGDGNGGPRMVSVDNAGQPIAPGSGSIVGGRTSTYHAMSADGHAIFWTPENGPSVVYARVDGATTIEASASQCTRGDCNAASPALFQGANASGTRVYFTTSQQLINGDTDETADLYECDIPSGTPTPLGAVNPCPDLHEVSGAASGAEVQGVTRISDDGSRVYFVAAGVLASNTDADGAQAMAGDNNLYVWTRDDTHPAGEARFVAKLDSADAPTPLNGGLWGTDYLGRFAQATDDGRFLVFASYSQLIDHGPQADTDTARDIYRYDAETGALTRLSTDLDGQGGNAPGQDAQITPIDYDFGGTNTSRPTRLVMSDDGGSVVFITSEALAPSDTNGTADTYLWHDGRVSLISSGKPSLDGQIPADGSSFGTTTRVLALISPSGRDVYFSTTARLVSGDEDTVLDIYDARVDGGFAPTSTPTPCVGESCRSQVLSPPGLPRSTTQETKPGNPPAVKRCRKGKVRRHGRCVKKRKAAKHHRAKHRIGAGKGGRK